MRTRNMGRTLAMVAISMLCLGAAWADTAAEVARTVSATQGDAIVTIKVAAKLKMTIMGNANTQEQKEEGTGVIVDPTGLIVTSLTAIDPSAALEQVLSSMDDEMKMQASVEITDLKVRRADGREFAAKIVLRDKDLDLIFLKPTAAPSQPLPAISLADATTPELMDELITVHRLDSVAGYATFSTLERVGAVVKKPRTFFVLGRQDSVTTVGGPAFALNGKLAGITTVRMPTTVKGIAAGIMRVVLPAADVAEVAQQALAVKD